MHEKSWDFENGCSVFTRVREIKFIKFQINFLYLFLCVRFPSRVMPEFFVSDRISVGDSRHFRFFDYVQKKRKGKGS